jgi:multidrug resistance efflux pump
MAVRETVHGSRQMDITSERRIEEKTVPDPGVPGEGYAIGFRFVRYFLSIILCSVGVMLGLMGFIGWHMGMDVTVVGQGQIEPTVRSKVKSQRSGLIQSVHVREGQTVHEGDLLLTLDETDLHSELEQLNQELAMNLRQQRALLEALGRERKILEAETMRAEVAHDLAILQFEQIEQEYRVYDRYLPFRSDGTARPHISSLLPIRLQRARVKGAAVDVERTRRQLMALDSRTEELQLLKLTHEKLEVAHRLLLSHLKQMHIYAGVSGTVLTRDLDQRVGDRVQPGETVIEMAEWKDWKARVRIPEIDIPRVKAGQVVRLYIDAFPHMKYKVFEGKVTDVPQKPEGALSTGEGMAPVGAMGSFYSVSIQVMDPDVSDGEKAYSLAYGMGVEAKVVTERGPIAALLWSKFLRTVGKIRHPEIYPLEEQVQAGQSSN